MKNLKFFLFLLIPLACSESNEIAKADLNYAELKDLIQTRKDFNDLVDGLIQDHFALTELPAETRSTISSRSNEILQSYGNDVPKGVYEKFLTLVEPFSKNTIPSLITLKDFLKNYNYSEADLKAVTYDIANEKISKSNSDGRVSCILGCTSDGCANYCIWSTLFAGFTAEYAFTIYYFGCLDGCHAAQ